mgnify:CR=1 FL=1
MFNLNNKGVAEVVQVLIITALSIVAIATVSSYFLSFSSSLEGKLSPAVDCLTDKSDILRVCVNPEGQVEALVNSVEEEIDIKINVNNQLFKCSTDADKCSTCLLTQGSKIIFISPTTAVSVGEEIRYSINGCPAESKTITVCVVP